MARSACSMCKIIWILEIFPEFLVRLWYSNANGECFSQLFPPPYVEVNVSN